MEILAFLASALLTCTPPVANVDGSALKTPVAYKFSMGTTAGGPYPNSSPTQSSCAYTWPNLNAGTYYFVATAIDNSGAASGNSNQASKLVPTIPQPVTVGGPVFSLQITKNSMVVPQIAMVVSGKNCDPTQTFAFAGVTYMRVDVANVVPIGNVDLSQTAAWAQCQ